jgi:hypothetical protein
VIVDAADRGDHFEEVVFAETGREESFDVLIVEASIIVFARADSAANLLSFGEPRAHAINQLRTR